MMIGERAGASLRAVKIDEKRFLAHAYATKTHQVPFNHHQTALVVVSWSTIEVFPVRVSERGAKAGAPMLQLPINSTNSKER